MSSPEYEPGEASEGQHEGSVSFTSMTEITLTPSSLKETLIFWGWCKCFYVVKNLLIPHLNFLWSRYCIFPTIFKPRTFRIKYCIKSISSSLSCLFIFSLSISGLWFNLIYFGLGPLLYFLLSIYLVATWMRQKFDFSMNLTLRPSKSFPHFYRILLFYESSKSDFVFM